MVGAKSSALDPERIGLRCLGLRPGGTGFQWFDGAGAVDVDYRVELGRQLRREVVALAFGLRPVDHADSALQPRGVEGHDVRPIPTSMRRARSG